MRILLTVHQFLPNYFSGTEILAYETACELRRRGHEVFVLTAEPDLPEVAREQPFSDDEVDGIPVHRFHHHPAVGDNPVLDEYNNPRVAAHVRAYAAKLQPDLVHLLHCHRLSACIIEVFNELRIPQVFTATDYWFVCPVTQLKRHDQSLCRGPSWSGVPCLRCYVANSQSADIRRQVPCRSNLKLWLFNLRQLLLPANGDERQPLVRALLGRRTYLRRQLNRVQRIFVTTDLMRTILIENTINPRLIRKLPFGINPEWTRSQRTKTSASTVRFGFVGTMNEYKGPHVLIKAFRALRQRRGATLNLFGDLAPFPDYVRYLKMLAAGDAEITFAGTFPNADIGRILENLDVLVAPSIWYENTPLIISHAFDTLTPVIASNLGGMAEVVSHRTNGLLFERGDHHGLAELLQEIIDEPALLSRLRQGIKPVTTIEESVTEIERTYAELVAPTPRGRVAAESG